MPAPGGQRDGSSACGWPTQIVGTAGSMPRSHSFTAFDTPSRPGVRCSSATLAELRRLPARRRLQRVVDLHVALAVAIVLTRARAFAASTRRLRQQPLVKLRRRHRADHAARRRDRLAAREPHAGRLAVGDDDLGDVGACAHLAALLADQRLEGRDGLRRAALHDRRARRFEREGDDAARSRRRRRSPAQARHAAPRARRARGRGRTRSASRARCGRSGAPRRDGRQGRAVRAATLPCRSSVAMPRVHSAPPSMAKRNGASRSTTPMSARKRSPSPGWTALSFAAFAARSIERIRLRPSGRSTPVGLAVWQNSRPCFARSGAELAEGRRRDEEHEGRRHHVVDVARRGDRLGAHAAAGDLLPLQHQHAPAFLAEQRRAGQPVDAASDDDVVGRHGHPTATRDPSPPCGERVRVRGDRTASRGASSFPSLQSLPARGRGQALRAVAFILSASAPAPARGSGCRCR